MVESMRCRNCGAALDAGRIDRALGIVVCAHCGGLHELAGERAGAPGSAADAGSVGSGGTRAVIRDRAERGTEPLSDRFDVRRGDGTLQVRWAEGSKSGAVVLAGFACVWAFAAITSGLILFAPVSLVLFYYAAVRGLNRTELRASAAGVDVRRGPLPWRGTRRHVTGGNVTQLFAREVVTRSANMDSGDRRTVRESRTYSVEALDAAGKRRALVSGLSSPGQALWFERELERLLDIEDVAVAGEVR